MLQKQAEQIVHEVAKRTGQAVKFHKFHDTGDILVTDPAGKLGVIVCYGDYHRGFFVRSLLMRARLNSSLQWYSNGQPSAKGTKQIACWNEGDAMFYPSREEVEAYYDKTYRNKTDLLRRGIIGYPAYLTRGVSGFVWSQKAA